MIYTKAGVPMDKMFWMGVMERKAAGLRRHKPQQWLRNLDGSLAYRVARDKTGAPYRIFRSIEWYV